MAIILAMNFLLMKILIKKLFCSVNCKNCSLLVNGEVYNKPVSTKLPDTTTGSPMTTTTTVAPTTTTVAPTPTEPAKKREISSEKPGKKSRTTSDPKKDNTESTSEISKVTVSALSDTTTVQNASKAMGSTSQIP